MTRIEILYMTNVVMIWYLLKKEYKDLLPQELLHYLESDDHNKVMCIHSEPLRWVLNGYN